MNELQAKLCTFFIKDKEKRSFVKKLIKDKTFYNKIQNNAFMLSVKDEEQKDFIKKLATDETFYEEISNKLSQSEKDNLFYAKKPEEYKVIMLLLVKDEADIIENNLIFHKNMGVDGFIVTDNNSSDGTRDILQKYKDKGWILELIDEPTKVYLQDVWVNRMTYLARDKYKADWIISADADEFFFAKSLNLKQDLYENRFSNVLKVNIRNYYPLSSYENYLKGEYFMSRRLSDQELQRIEASTEGEIYQTSPKTIVAGRDIEKYCYGNHAAEVFNKRTANISNIEIFHYAVRSLQHLEGKIKKGGEALKDYPDKQIGTHWRRWYEQFYLQNRIPELFKSLYDSERLGSLLDMGYVTVDTRVKDYMESLNI